jgi:hypothetical protein
MKHRSTQITSLCTTTLEKTYKHGSEDTISQIGDELKGYFKQIGDCHPIEQMKKREAFISLKDHKENFENNLKCRLISLCHDDEYRHFWVASNSR